MTLSELACTTWSARRHASAATGLPVPEWDDTPPEWKSLWRDAVAKVLAVMDEGEGLKFSDLGRQLCHEFTEGQGEQATGLALLPYTAAVRHLANMSVVEDVSNFDIEHHELHWNQWAKNELNKEIG